MKTTIKVAAIGCLVVAVFFAALHYLQKSSSVSIALSGTPGAKVSGAYVTDGVLKTFSFRLPASLQFDSKYEFSVKAEKENPAEEFILSIDTVSGFHGKSRTDSIYKGVEVHFSSFINKLFCGGSIGTYK